MFTHNASGLVFSVSHHSDFRAYVSLRDPAVVLCVEIAPDAMHTIDGWLTMRLLQYIKWLAIDNVCAEAKSDVIHLVVWHTSLLHQQFRSEMFNRHRAWCDVNRTMIEQADRKLNAWRAADAALTGGAP